MSPRDGAYHLPAASLLVVHLRGCREACCDGELSPVDPALPLVSGFGGRWGRGDPDLFLRRLILQKVAAQTWGSLMALDTIPE